MDNSKLKSLRLIFALALASAACVSINVHAEEAAETLRIPAVANGPKRAITTDDLARLRDIDTLSVAPDGGQFAILVRQAVPERNTHRLAWFIGSTTGGPFRFLADGGEVRLSVYTNGSTGGDFGGSPARWSPDGKTIAFLKKADDEVQVWRVETDGSGARQVSHNPGDVRDMSWSPDGKTILFSAQESREARAAVLDRRNLEGHRLQDFNYLGVAVHSGKSAVALSADPPIFVVNADGSAEREATAEEKKLFADLAASRYGPLASNSEIDTAKASAAYRPPSISSTGAYAWLAKVHPEENGQLPLLRVYASTGSGDSAPVACMHADCTSQIVDNFQWSADGSEVLFTRWGGSSMTDNGLFAWNPRTGKLRSVTDVREGSLEACTLAGPRFVCLREERLKPEYVLAIDVASGRQTVLADVNPEFAQFKLGRIERIEWNTPSYPKGPTATTAGFIIYPPDYDPNKTYPLMVMPYSTYGFARGDAGDEHPMLAYAAKGFVVLNSGIPIEWDLLRECADAGCTFDAVYDPKGNYAHLSALAATTIRGIDETAKHANIDIHRVGTGGVSHGAFIPLFMLQMDDRLAALSIAQGSWMELEYYASRLVEPWEEPDPSTAWVRKDPEFWRPIDFAQHLDTIEAPILFQFADSELFRSYTQVRDMADAHLPFEAYVFPGEYHFKWQSAHKLAVYNRNMDWFRFWLQDYEDTAPSKVEQYVRWRKLRELQCRNPRSTRAYCHAGAD